MGASSNTIVRHRSQDELRWEKGGRERLKERAAQVLGECVQPRRPYVNRELSANGTGCHYDEYPWMPWRATAAYAAGEEDPGNHCFDGFIESDSPLADYERDVLVCRHCGAWMVSDSDQVQQEPCPSEPRAILQWFGALLEVILRFRGPVAPVEGGCALRRLSPSSPCAGASAFRLGDLCPLFVRKRKSARCRYSFWRKCSNAADGRCEGASR